MSEPPIVMLALIADGHEAMLRTLTSVLNVQTVLATRPDPPFMVELTVVRSANDALDALYRDKKLAAGVLVGANAGFDAEFAVRAFESGRRLVLGASPLPVIDWDRARLELARGTDEPPRYVGNEYNVDLGELDPADPEYARVTAVRDVAVMFVRREVVDDMAASDPGLVADKCAFALDGIEGGRFERGVQRFVRRVGEAWADVARKVVVAGPVEFVGSVGGRARLR